MAYTRRSDERRFVTPDRHRLPAPQFLPSPLDEIPSQSKAPPTQFRYPTLKDVSSIFSKSTSARRPALPVKQDSKNAQTGRVKREETPVGLGRSPATPPKYESGIDLSDYRPSQSSDYATSRRTSRSTTSHKESATNSLPLTPPSSLDRKPAHKSSLFKKENANVPSGRAIKHEDGPSTSTLPEYESDDPFRSMGTPRKSINRHGLQTPSEKPEPRASRQKSLAHDQSEAAAPSKSADVDRNPFDLTAANKNLPQQGLQTPSKTRHRHQGNGQAPFALGALPLSPQSEPRRTNVANRSVAYDATPSKAPTRKARSTTSGVKVEEETPDLLPSFSLHTPRAAAAASLPPPPTSPPPLPPLNPPSPSSSPIHPVPFDRTFLTSLTNPILPGYTLSHCTLSTDGTTVRKVYSIPGAGDVLQWYQTADAEVLYTEHMVRFAVGEGARDERDREWVRGCLKGKVLGYEMGLGKTHVACVVLDRTRVQRGVIKERLKIQAPLKPDLIVAPLSLHAQWEEHLVHISNGALKVVIYPDSKSRNPGFPEDAHVIIINIEKLRAQYTRYRAYQDMIEEDEPDKDWTKLTEADIAYLQREAPLLIVHFNTIVIDECHQNGLSDPSSLGGRTMLSMLSDNFLLLSGTPAQNTLEEMQMYYALCIDVSRRKNVRDAEKLHRLMGLRKKIRARDVVDFLDGGEVDRLLPSCIITRKVVNPVTKQCLITLPARHDFIVEVRLTEKERSLYELKTKMTAPEALVRVLRQRQVCLHPTLVQDTLIKPTSDSSSGKSKFEEYDDVTREFDPDPKSGAARFLKVPSNATIKNSLISREPEYLAGVKDAGIDMILHDEYVSSKFRALYTILARVPAGEKTIIFSTFTSLLDVLGTFLDSNNVDFVQYDGRKTPEEKQRALKMIADDVKCKVILVSMKAGGVGLNITSCNHAIIFDPWWNPYAEEQAISRTYRLGQKRQVYVYRIVCPKTIEDRIIEIQDEKRTKIDSFFDACAAMTHRHDVDYLASASSSAATAYAFSSTRRG